MSDRGGVGTGEWAQTWQALVALAVAAYIGAAVVGDRSSATAAAVTYVVILICSVALHEAGHAVAVLAIGGRVREVRLGFGPVLLDRTIRGVHWDVRPLIIAGHVGWEPPPSARRSQLIAVAAAGIAVHFVLILLATFGGGAGPWDVWRIDLLIANVLSLVSNAIPSTMSVTTTSAGPNDGAHLRALLAGSRAAAARRDEPAWMIAQRDARTALWALIGAGLPDTSEPGTAAARQLTAAEGSIRAVEAALAGGLPDLERASAMHTVALARLAQDRNAAAERLAAAVVALLPEGWNTDRAAALSTVGWAALRQGRRSDAERFLSQAMGLDREEALTVAFGAALSRMPRA